jgi:hypothetical protein
MHICHIKRTLPGKAVRLVCQTGKKGLNFSSQVMKLPVLSAFTLTKKAKLRRGVTLRELFEPSKRIP